MFARDLKLDFEQDAAKAAVFGIIAIVAVVFVVEAIESEFGSLEDWLSSFFAPLKTAIRNTSPIADYGASTDQGDDTLSALAGGNLGS